MKTLQWLPIPEVTNYYGSLHIAEHNGKYYWAMQNWDNEDDLSKDSKEIPKELFDQLLLKVESTTESPESIALKKELKELEKKMDAVREVQNLFYTEKYFNTLDDIHSDIKKVKRKLSEL